MSTPNRLNDIGGAIRPPDRRRRDDYDKDDEIDLREYGLALWRRRVPVIAGALAVAMVALAGSLLMPRTYSAVALLAINQSKLSPTGQTSAMTTASYRPILESQNLASTLVREFGLDRRGWSAVDLFGTVLTI